MKRSLTKVAVYFLCFAMMFTSFVYPVQAYTNGTAAVYGVKGLAGDMHLSVDGSGFLGLTQADIRASIKNVTSSEEIFPTEISIFTNTQIGLKFANSLQPGLYNLMLWADPDKTQLVTDAAGKEFNLIPMLNASYINDASGTKIKVLNSPYDGYRWNVGSALDIYIGSITSSMDLGALNTANKIITKTDAELFWTLPAALADGKYFVEIKETAGKMLGVAEFFVGTANTTNPVIDGISFMLQGSDNVSVHGFNLSQLNIGNISAAIMNGNVEVGRSIRVENDYEGFRFIFDKSINLAPGNYYLQVWNGNTTIPAPNNGLFHVVQKLSSSPYVLTGTAAGQTITVYNSTLPEYKWTLGEDISVEFNGPNVHWTATLTNGLTLTDNNLTITTPVDLPYPLPVGEYRLIVKRGQDANSTILGISKIMVGPVQVSGKVVKPEDQTIGVGGGFIRVENKLDGWSTKYPVNADGSFLISNLTANTEYSIEAVAPEGSIYSNSPKQVVKYQGETVNISLGLTMPQFTGTIVDPFNNPIGYSRVEIFKPEVDGHGSKWVGAVDTDSQGVFKVGNLAPGKYSIEGAKYDSEYIRSDRFEVIIDSQGVYIGTVTNPQLKLISPQVKGRIFDKSGNISFDSHLEISSVNGEGQFSSSTNNGMFYIGKLGYGTYKVRGVPTSGNLSPSFDTEIKVDATGIYVNNAVYDITNYVDLYLTDSQIKGKVYESANTLASYGRIEVYNELKNLIYEANINHDGSYALGGLAAGKFNIRAVRYDNTGSYESDMVPVEIWAGNMIKIAGVDYDAAIGYNFYLKAKVWQNIDQHRDYKISKSGDLTLDFHGFNGDVSKLSVELGYTPVTIKLDNTYVTGSTTNNTDTGIVFPILRENNREYVQFRDVVNKFNGTINWNDYDKSTNINIGGKSAFIKNDDSNLLFKNGRNYITLEWLQTNMQMSVSRGEYVRAALLANPVLKGQSTDGYKKTVGFTPDIGTPNILNTFIESIYLNAKVMYFESVGNVKSELLWKSVELDLAPPFADVFFKGLVHDSVDNKDYFEVKVEFFDQVLLEDVVANKDTYFKLTHNGLTVSPVKVVPEFPEQTAGPVGRVKLYFAELSSGDLITVHGLKDIVGNTMTKDITNSVRVSARIRVTLKDGAGNVLPNTNFMFVRTDSLSSMKSAAGDTTDNGTSTGLKTEGRMTDNEGISVLDLEQGSYRIYSANLPAPEYKRVQLDVDFEAKPQVGIYEIPLEVIVAEKPGNVTGKANIQALIDAYSTTGGTTTNGYELTFIEKKFLQAPFTTVDQYMLQDTFGKKAVVSSTGDFSLFLTPGETGSPREYILIGAKQYQGNNTFILPKNEIKVLVEGNQVVSINNGTPIEFATQEITVGKLYKSQTEIQGDVDVQIERLGFDYSVAPFKTWVDFSGEIRAKLPNGNYKISVIIKNGNTAAAVPNGTTTTSGSTNATVYTTDVTFAVSEGTVSSITGNGVTVGLEGTQNINKIVLPAINATVNLVKKGVLLAGHSNLTFMNYDGREIYLHNSNSGRFDFSLVPGTYKIRSISAQDSSFTSVEKDPKSTLIVGEGFDKTGSNAIVYDFGIGNVFIKVVNDNVTQDVRPNISLNISGQRDEDGMMVYRWGKTDSDGLVSFNLKPGKYNITGFDDGGNWKQVNIPFEVKDTDTIEVPKTVTFKISPPNAKFIFRDEAGTLLSGKWVNIKKIRTANEYWDMYIGFNTDQNGEYRTNLKPGEYIIEGIQTSKEWKQLNLSFTVDDTISSANPLIKEVVIAAPVLNAILKDEIGNPITYTWINLRKLASTVETWDRYFGFNTDGEGKFSGDLEPGEYLVEGINIWKPNANGGGYYEWREIKKKFYVVKNAQEKLELRITAEGAAQTLLEISIPRNNFTGYLYKTYDELTQTGTPFAVQNNANGDWTNISLVLKQKDVAIDEFNNRPWLYQKWINVKADGSFSVMLDALYDYVITEVFVEGVRYEINQIITKELLNTQNHEFVIVPPKPNVSGTIKDFNDTPVANKGWINFSSPDNTKWEWAEIAADGTFGKNMEAGQQYTIREITIMGPDNDWNTAQRFQLDKTFTVGTDSQDMVIKPNLKGSIDFGSLFNGTAPQYVSISIRQKILSGDPKYDDYILNPWKYDKWMAVTMSADAATGTFFTSLGEGTYTINGLSTTQGWQQMSEEFTLSQSTTGNVTYESELTRYILNINVAANVTGEIIDINGLGIDGASVSIERTGDLGQVDNNNTAGAVFNWQDRYFNVNTDSTGKFAIKLKDGNYRINGYNTKWQQDANGGWISGQWVNLNYVFKVEGGVLKNIDDLETSTLPKIVIKPNVKIVVAKVYNAGDWADGYAEVNLTPGQYAKLKYAWVNIKPYKFENGVYTLNENEWSNNVWANTNANGEGILTLKPGKYRLLDAGGNNFYTRIDKDLTIDIDGNMVDDDAATNFIDPATKTLTISQKLPNFKGTVYIDKANDIKLNSGWISVAQGTSGEVDWSKTRWFNVKADGTFEEFLGDSEAGWRIINVSGYKADGSYFWMKSNITLTVENGIVTPDNPRYLNTTTNTLEIIPPVENLIGTVSYKSYSDNLVKQVVGNAWLTIKPANNKANDWTGAFGADYKDYGNGDYKFSLVADPGSYKVVSVGGYDSQKNEYFWYEADIRFTIDADGKMVYDNAIVASLNIAPPLPNVTGTATINGGQAVNKGSISFVRFNSSHQQVMMNGEPISAADMAYKYAGDDIHWWFARWTEVDEAGKFGINLPVIDDGGYYKVINVYGQNGWYRADAKFTVETENNVNVLKEIDDSNNKSTTPSLSISQPGPNVTLNITNAPSASDKAWIEVELNENGNKSIYSFASEPKENSDNNFTFKARLKNGTYVIKNIGTSTAWNTVDGGDFTVVTGSNTFGTDLSFLTTRKVLTGQILGVTNSVWVALQQYDANDAAIGEKKWIQTDSTGNFSLKVETDSKWAVVNVKSSEGNKSVDAGKIDIITASAGNTEVWSVDITTDLI